MHKAIFFKNSKDNKIECNLCAHNCIIKDGKRGICGVRENRNKELYSLVYGKIVAKNVDPIEKKPFYHFMPGTNTYSIGTVGCNFKCHNCQNFDISQTKEIVGIDMTKEEVVQDAINHACSSIAYTYNEPTVFYEFMFDCAKLAKEKGISNVMVTNGYMSKEAIKRIAPYIDAVNIDLKFFKDKSYKEIASAKLQPVLDAIKLFYDLGIHIEITTLIIPEVNDTTGELKKIAEFIKSIDSEIPWHVSAFHPMHKMLDKEQTPIKILENAFKVGKKAGLSYVYVGNVTGISENTNCPKCNKILIKRQGYTVFENNIKNGKCECGNKIYYV
ncbi:MAG: AmmeMemoRadiSam system radical SAM enzyme [Candidatus Woesearchaeota archaeon]|jgi:pyruvate formate lyase activating enzyme